MPRASRSLLTCLCSAVVCAASTMAFADGLSRTVAINVTDANGQASSEASVAVRTADGQMTQADASGSIYVVKNVGQKVTIQASHPQYGSVTIETELPMVDPVFVEIQFIGPNRALLTQLDVTDLGAIASRAPGSWNQDPGAAEENGGGCANCLAVGDGVTVGSNCGNSEADITSCTFSDTMTDWLCYTASCDGTATASTCGSGFDTALSVWDACGGSQLACNDDACGLQSTINWAVTSGTTYYIRVSGFNNACGSYSIDISCVGGGGGDGCGDCDVPNGTPGCSDQDCQDLICGMDAFCCDVDWDAICADAALVFCNCGGPPCQSDDDCAAGEVCIDGNCVVPACDIECPAGALEEGEPCGDDTNGGCNSVPPAFTDAACGDTFCGTAWAAGDRDTDWYLVNHGGGILSATPTSQFQGVCFIVSGIGSCSPVVEGDIGCSSDCNPIADASADLAAGQYVVFVATGTCDGGGIFDGVPCGGGSNDYTVSISCEGAVTGACCLPDNTCVDGISQSECEDAPSSGDCGNCGVPHDGVGCSDDDCQALVCGADAFCCDVGWDQICADAALDLCDCGTGGGGLGGEYQGDDTVCDGPTCGPPTGGCCQCDGDEAFCTDETEDDCAALGGLYLGDGADCESAGGQIVFTSSPNTAIPDNNPFGILDTIVVGDSFSVLDLEVEIDISHTWIGDLCVSLSKDGGGAQLLMSRIGADTGGNACHSGSPFGCSENNMNVVLDDDAGSSIEDQCAAGLSGTYAPDPGSLASFIGGDSAGSYTLNVVDNAAGDLGALVSWSLIFTAPAAGGSPCEDAGHVCIQTGGCCQCDGLDQFCTVETEDNCAALGGEYLGDGSDCESGACEDAGHSCNEAPDCSGAFASAGELWPPNHAYHDITVEGVTDPDGDTVTITITGIFQDESVNGTGDGNTCPDGTGVGTSTASVRAERSGQGDGRVYHISYVASDGQGGECEGTVTVCVPHSQGGGGGCVDQGPLFDSTDCSGAGAAGANGAGAGSRRNIAVNR